MTVCANRLPLAGLIAVFLLSFMPSAHTEERENLSLLENAFTASRTCSYATEIRPAKWPDFPKATKVFFYRKCEQDGFILLRADLFEGERLAWTFIQNRDGRFAVHHKTGTIASGGAFMRLYQLEDLFNRPVKYELALADYKISDARYRSRDCLQLVMHTPETPPEGMDELLYFMDELRVNDASSKVLAQHPFKRVFLIDKKENVILSVKKYNANGNLLSTATLGNVMFNPDWNILGDKLFATPSHIDMHADTTAQFRRHLLKTLVPITENKTNQTASWRAKCAYWLHAISGWTWHYGKYALAVVGLVCIAAVVWLKRRG